MVVGLYCALFIGGWGLPAINDQLGYAGLCRKAVEISETGETSGYCVLNIRRPENMDVYLHEDIRVVTVEELLEGKYKDAVLMVSNKKINSDKDLQKFLSGKERHIVGRYSVMKL